MTTAPKFRVVALCPRKYHVLGTVYVRATDRDQAIRIGRRVLPLQGVKKLSVMRAYEWSPETDRELVASGFVGPVVEAMR